MSRLLEWGLRAWAVVLSAAAMLWVLGPYGVGLVAGQHLLRRPFSWFLTDTGPLDGLLTGPVFPARLTEDSARRAISDLSEQLTDYDGGSVSGSFADIGLGWHVQVSSMTGRQQWAFLALHVLPLLVLAVAWWSLASVVRQSRHERVFTDVNARRLTLAGLVITLGAPLLAVATWVFQRWVVDTSQLSGRVAVPGFGVGSVPWAAVAAGVALLVLGGVWRRGVSMERDLAGLV